MTEQSIRKVALLKSGTLSPNPWDLTLSGQNGRRYNTETRTEDKAPQGCDLSADSGAGMARAAAMLRSPQNTQIPTRPRLTYCGPNLVLTMGSTLVQAAASPFSPDLTVESHDEYIQLAFSFRCHGRSREDLFCPYRSGRIPLKRDRHLDNFLSFKRASLTTLSDGPWSNRDAANEYASTIGRFCIIRGGPENKRSGVVQRSDAKMPMVFEFECPPRIARDLDDRVRDLTRTP